MAVLRGAVKRVRRECRQNNPLARIALVPPLCVAGESSIVIVRAEGLRLRGVPVETSPGEGSPLAIIKERLRIIGHSLCSETVLHLYGQLMAWQHDALPHHPDRRIARIPTLTRTIRTERAGLEGRLREYVRRFDSRTFSVAVACERLSTVLREIKSPWVLLGYAGQGVLRVAGQYDVAVGWGQGCGLASVATNDLRGLVEGSGSKMACIDCDLNGWDAWCDRLETMVQATLVDMTPPSSQRFEYFYQDQEAV